jgi:hypothetical protein
MYVENLPTSPRLIPSTRFTLALLLSLGLFVQYTQRVSLSMGIVCMVNRTNSNTPSRSTSYPGQFVNTTSIIRTKYGSHYLEEKIFFMTESQQQILFAANWLGYLCTLIPGR